MQGVLEHGPVRNKQEKSVEFIVVRNELISY